MASSFDDSEKTVRINDNTTQESLLPLPRLFAPGLGHIDLGPPIGRGGMGLVSLGVQTSLTREVAIKSLLPGATAEGDARGLLHEGLVLGSLEHPNVIPVYMLGVDERGLPVIVMKRVTGVVWTDFLGRTHKAPDEVEDALEWNLRVLIQVARAAHFAHTRGIVHRDIKPDNVMIGEHGEVYLLDWGLAVALDDRAVRSIKRVSELTGVAGSPAFMAPEMCKWGSPDLSARTDVYLLGACLYAVLVGHGPHQSKSAGEALQQALEAEPPVFSDDVPSELSSVVRRALSKLPLDRYATASAFVHAIEEYLTHRHSHRLVQVAERRELQLVKLLQEERQKTGRDHAHIHRVFGEARFGFQQAIAAWSNNQDAITGDARAIVLMVDYLLDDDDLDFANALAHDLIEIPNDLARKFERARERVLLEQHRIAQLEKIRADADVRPYSTVKSRLSFARAIAWVSTFLFLGLAARRGWFVAEYKTYFAISCFHALVNTVAWWVLRRTTESTQMARKFGYAMQLATVGPILYFPLAAARGVPFAFSLTVIQLFYFLATAALALSTHLSLMWAALAFIVGYFATTAFPSLAYEIFAVTTGVSMWAASRMWLRLASENQSIPPSTLP